MSKKLAPNDPAGNDGERDADATQNVPMRPLPVAMERHRAVPDSIAVEVHSAVDTSLLGRARRQNGHSPAVDAPLEAVLLTPAQVKERIGIAGLNNVPPVAALREEDYASGEAYADAVCAALAEFRPAGLETDRVRDVLLSGRQPRPQEFCATVAGRHFIMLGFCGRGGFGTVHRVAEVTDPKTVHVLKRIDVSRIGQDIRTVDALIEQSGEEATILARVGELVAADTVDNGHTVSRMIVRHHYEGTSIAALREAAPDGKLPPAVAAWLALKMARSLQSTGDILHLDIKDQNVIVSPTSDGGIEPKLIDRGSSKIIEPGQEQLMPALVPQTMRASPPEMTPFLLSDERLAASGTPPAAEADRDKATQVVLNAAKQEDVLRAPTVNRRSDVYSLLLLTYEMLSGRDAIPELAVGQLPEKRFAAYHDFKAKYDPQGEGSGILRFLNTDDPADPEHRSKLYQATDWAYPYADAGAKLREIFAAALQIKPEDRPDLNRLVADLETVCRELQVNREHGPRLGVLQRNSDHPIGQQISPEALYAAISQHNTPINRVNRYRVDEKDADSSVLAA